VPPSPPHWCLRSQDTILNTDFGLFLYHVHDHAALKTAVAAVGTRAKEVIAALQIVGDAVQAAWPSWTGAPSPVAARIVGPLIRWLPIVMTGLKKRSTPSAAAYQGTLSTKGACPYPAFPRRA
jgi:hypothetical protein